MTKLQAEAVEREAAKIMLKLTAKQVAYAGRRKRGARRGFGALYDLMDANELLPGKKTPSRFPFLLQVRAAVTRMIIERKET